MQRCKLVLVLAFFSFNFSLFADDEKRISNLESQMQQIKEENVKGTLQGKNASARGCPEVEHGDFITVDFLYWKAQSEGFPYALHLSELTNVGGAFFITGSRVLRIDYDWNPGFRACVGWNTDYDDWNVNLVWTYYHNHSKDSHGEPNPGSLNVSQPNVGLFGIWSGLNNNNQTFRFASASWRLNYNMADLEWGRGYFVSQYLSFRPHFGLRVGFIHQAFRTRYDDPVDPTSADLPMIFTAHNNVWGVGARGGINSNWHLGRGFSAFGNLSAALLYGKVDVHARGRQERPGQIFTETFKYEDDHLQLLPTLQIYMGFGWGSCLDHGKMFLSFQLGWETNIWWNQFDLPFQTGTFISTIPFPSALTRPLTLEGITLDMKLDF